MREPHGWCVPLTSSCSPVSPFCVYNRPRHFLFIHHVCFSQLLSLNTGFILIVVIPKNVLFANNFKFIKSEKKNKNSVKNTCLSTFIF